MLTDSSHRFTVAAPDGSSTILLHSCCAPCSSAIIECLLNSGITPVVFFYNPNIFPFEEYLRRKEEIIRYTTAMRVPFVDADYDHEEWISMTADLKEERERGRRCLECFKIRLLKAARYASSNGLSIFTTTLASSRWKDLNQITEAGRFAATTCGDVTFWEHNWRKNGLSERRRDIIKEFNFYNQQYCGCEYSFNK